MISVAEARARGITLPIDEGAAEDIVIEQEAWLARRIGPLDGERSETWYVGISATRGKLSLARYTDEVELTDNGVAVDAGSFRLVDRGSAVVPTAANTRWWWTGPYVVATYTPNDFDEVRRVLFGLVALAVSPDESLDSERIGDYSYTRGSSAGSVPAARAALVSSILPVRDQATTLRAVDRFLTRFDPVINRPEPDVP